MSRSAVVTVPAGPSERADDARPQRGRARSVVQAVVLAAPVVGFVAAGWAKRWIVDDGFIYLRVVQQVRVGNGPVFNEGERVEAFTGPLWVAILSVTDLVTPIRLEWIAVILGLAGCAIGIVAAMAGARRLASTRGDDHFVFPFGVLVFAAILPAWIFATSGLETGLSFAWLGVSLWLLADWAAGGGRMPARRGFVLGLGWLVRPELVLFSVAFLVIVLGSQWRGDRWRDRARFTVAVVALPFAYQVFRMAYYGALVANTAIAKEGTSTNWSRGWDYLRDFVDPYWLWMPLVLLVAGGYAPLLWRMAEARARRATLVVVAFAGVAVLQGVYFVAVGGDYMHARLFLPGLFALCAPVAVVPVTRRHVAALLLVPWFLAAVVSLRPPQAEQLRLADPFILPMYAGKVTIEDFGWGDDGPRREWYTGPAFYFQRSVTDVGFERSDAPLRTNVDLPVGALLAIGRTSYALGPDFDVIDVLGLADPLASHLISTPSPGLFPRLPGHEKPMPSVWIAARLTPEGADVEPEDFPNSNAPLIPVTEGEEFDEQVAWARAALRCPEIRRLFLASESPLGLRALARNFVRSFENTRVRIPADPEAAYRKFCGGGTPAEVERTRRGTGSVEAVTPDP